MYNNNISPIGWYVCSYLLRFIECNNPLNEDENTRFLSWENRVFEGVTDILPIYEELKDGAEIMWRERMPRKLKNLRTLTRKKHEFIQ